MHWTDVGSDEPVTEPNDMPNTARTNFFELNVHSLICRLLRQRSTSPAEEGQPASQAGRQAAARGRELRSICDDSTPIARVTEALSSTRTETIVVCCYTSVVVVSPPSVNAVALLATEREHRQAMILMPIEAVSVATVSGRVLSHEQIVGISRQCDITR